MLRSMQIWIPALAFLGALGFASIAVTLDRDAPDGLAAAVPPPATVPVAPAPQPILDTAPDTPAARAPSGVLTYLAGDGERITIAPGDPASVPELVEPPSTALFAATAAGVYRSPDDRYLASIRRDETGVWIDIAAGAQIIEVLQIAGPDDPDLVVGKGPAAALDGVPLTVAWSPDSRYLAYGSITHAPFSLAVVRSDTWSTLRREVSGGYVGELAWAPDSSRLAISTYALDRSDHTTLIYDPQRKFVRHLIDGCAIVWAPDSAFLAVHREPAIDSGVWITSPDGETRIEVVDDARAFPVAWAERSS